MSLQNGRRFFLAQSGVMLAGVLLGGSKSIAASTSPRRYLTSGVRGHDGYHHLALIDLQQNEEHLIPVNQRGHSMALNTKLNQVLFFDRRPGSFIYICNGQNPKIEKTLIAPEKRRFYGHGSFSVHNQYLYVPANDLETLEGRILIYDASRDYQLIDDVSSGGIGPHEIIRHPEKDLFYVCNGGLKTHPDTGREILNFDNIETNLAAFQGPSFEPKKIHVFQTQWQSFRHIDVNAHGHVAIGAQDVDFFPGDSKPVACFFKDGLDSVVEIWLDASVYARIQGYVASVALSRDSKTVFLTCPKGNLGLAWNAETQQTIDLLEIPEASGVAFDQQEQRFLITTGFGKIFEYKNQTLRLLSEHSFQFDNHAELFI